MLNTLQLFSISGVNESHIHSGITNLADQSIYTYFKNSNMKS